MRPCPHAPWLCLLNPQRLVGVVAEPAPKGAAAGIRPMPIPLAWTVVELAVAVAAAVAVVDPRQLWKELELLQLQL